MEVSGQLHASAASPPGKELAVPIRYEAVWALEPVWTMKSTEKILAPAGNGTLAVKLVAHPYTD
jgi:hypothetical protein